MDYKFLLVLISRYSYREVGNIGTVLIKIYNDYLQSQSWGWRHEDTKVQGHPSLCGEFESSLSTSDLSEEEKKNSEQIECSV